MKCAEGKEPVEGSNWSCWNDGAGTARGGSIRKVVGDSQGHRHKWD